MCIVHWLNDNSGAISALATVTIAVLTYILVRIGRIQAEAGQASVKVAEALRDIERRRDEADDPLVYLFFHGYGGHQQATATFTLQNSGKRSLMLSRMTIEVDGGVEDVQFYSVDMRIRGAGSNPVLDLVIPPELPVKFTFKLRSGGNLPFSILFQLHIGDPKRMKIDPSIFNGYLLKARGSQVLEVTARAYQGQGVD